MGQPMHDLKKSIGPSAHTSQWLHWIDRAFRPVDKLGLFDQAMGHRG
jgi:hypothetical protein